MHTRYVGVCCGLVLTILGGMVPVQAALENTKIAYSLQSLGSQQWQYTYALHNVSLTPALNFLTIYFPYGAVELVSHTPAALQLDFQENLVAGPWGGLNALPVEGYYDITTDSLPLGPGMSVSGFSVSFKWLGAGIPGDQYYEIYSPDFETLDSGRTFAVPEPSLMALLVGGVIWSSRRRLG